MHLEPLSARIVAFLAPFLPYLCEKSLSQSNKPSARFGHVVWENFESHFDAIYLSESEKSLPLIYNRFEQSQWEKAEELWRYLGSQIEGKLTALEATLDLVSVHLMSESAYNKPRDFEQQVSFRQQIRKLLEQNLSVAEAALQVMETEDVYRGLLPRIVTRLSHDGPVYGAAFSPDGSCFATVQRKFKSNFYYDSTIRFWEIDSNRELHQVHVVDRSILYIAFSPDSQCLIVAFHEGVQLIDLVSGREELKSYAKTFSVSANGRFLAFASGQGITVVDVSNEYPTSVITQKGVVKQIELSADGKYIAVLGDKKIQIREVKSDRRVGSITVEGKAHCAAFSPDDKYLVTAGHAFYSDSSNELEGIDEVTVWTVQDGEALTQEWSSCDAALFSPDGRWLAMATGGYVTLTDSFAYDYRHWGIQNDSHVRTLAFSPDSNYLAIAWKDSTVSLWDLSLRLEVAHIRHDDAVNTIRFSFDGRYLITVSDDKTAQVWKVLEHPLQRTLPVITSVRYV
jgi:WD40 repeat protein